VKAVSDAGSQPHGRPSRWSDDITDGLISTAFDWQLTQLIDKSCSGPHKSQAQEKTSCNRKRL